MHGFYKKHIIWRFHSCRQALIFPVSSCSVLTFWCLATRCLLWWLTQGQARGDSPGESPGKGSSAKGCYQMRWGLCSDSDTLKSHYSFITVLPFITKHAPEMLCLNKVLQIQSCVKCTGRTHYSHDSYKANFIHQS